MARKLAYLADRRFQPSIGIYALMIDLAVKIVGKSDGAENPKAFFKMHLKELKAHCDANSKTILRNKTVRKEHFRARPNPSSAYVATDAFLESYEWRKLRMQALKLHGARCQCCGASPAQGAIMNVDHIKPRKLFPELALELSNLQVLCHECNHGKGNWDMTDWRPVDEADPAAIDHLKSILREKF